MDRRFFLNTSMWSFIINLMDHSKLFSITKEQNMEKRLFRDDVKLSIIGLGGVVALGMDQNNLDNLIDESIETGVNYFDVAPTYGDGEAEIKFGQGLKAHRKRIFLACKTTERNADGAQFELDRSLKRLHTDYFDLYQFHAVTTMDEVEKIFAKGGAVELFIRAKEQGKIKYIGFSAHSVEAALAMLDRYPFDSVLFPINFVCTHQGNFGPQVIEKAKEKNVARLALKAMAYSPWPEGSERKWKNCWYRPVDELNLAAKALGFTLSQDITAAVPPGEEKLFRMALNLALKFRQMDQDALTEIRELAEGITPLFRT